MIVIQNQMWSKTQYKLELTQTKLKPIRNTTRLYADKDITRILPVKALNVWKMIQPISNQLCWWRKVIGHMVKFLWGPTNWLIVQKSLHNMYGSCKNVCFLFFNLLNHNHSCTPFFSLIFKSLSILTPLR